MKHKIILLGAGGHALNVIELLLREQNLFEPIGILDPNPKREHVAGVPIIGTSPDSIDLAEDRERFKQLIDRLGLKQPPNRTASNEEEAIKMAAEVGYPLVVRPSYVLGGRAMEVVFEEEDLRGKNKTELNFYIFEVKILKKLI